MCIQCMRGQAGGYFWKPSRIVNLSQEVSLTFSKESFCLVFGIKLIAGGTDPVDFSLQENYPSLPEPIVIYRFYGFVLEEA